MRRLAAVVAISCVAIASLALRANAQASPEEQCASLKSNAPAYEKCVESIKQSQARVTPAATSPTPRSGQQLVEESQNSQRRMMLIAVTGGIALATLLIGLSVLRTARRVRSYPVAEVTELLESMIPPEVRERDPAAKAVPIPAGGGRSSAKLMLVSVIVAVCAIVGGLGIALSGHSDKIWIVPIVLLPFGALYGWWVVKVGARASDDWLAPLGLRVTKTPGAVIGPNPAGFAGGNLLRPYVVGPTVIEGVRHGRNVSITQESAGVGPISIRVVVDGKAPAASCRGERGSWNGGIPAGAAGDVIRSSSTGPGSATIAGGGDGLVLIRQVSVKDLLSRDGYGLLIRDLDLTERVISAS